MARRRFLGLAVGIVALLALVAIGRAELPAQAQDSSGPTPNDEDVFKDVSRVDQLVREIVDGVGSVALISREDPASPAPDLIVDVTARNWSWDLTYRDADGGDLAEVSGSDAAPPRNRLVAPVNSVVRLNVTSADVIHDLAIPAFGLKVSGIPGRLESAWFHADEIGEYQGECMELCGLEHAQMTLVVEVVALEDFEARFGSLR